MRFQLGDTISADGELYQVVGRITYKNINDGCQWDEYRLFAEKDRSERWLSVDDVYKEYSIWEMTRVFDHNGYHWSDHGTQIVMSCEGNVDVERGDRAEFTEYEDETEELIIASEIWSDGVEHSKGYYLDDFEIWHVRSNPTARAAVNTKKSGSVLTIVIIAMLFIAPMISTIIGSIEFTPSIAKYLKKSDNYTYVTSITGNEKQSADVYRAGAGYTIDLTTRDIIDAIDGKTEYVQQDDSEEDGSVAILTSKEYCLIYKSTEDEVLVQVSSRKYAYTTDDDPYHSTTHSRRYYRGFYHSRGYYNDTVDYGGKYSSPYSTYDGDTIEYSYDDVYNNYSNSIRQASIDSRSSSGGGLSGGK